MVIYIKFNQQDENPLQFTTVLEAKEYLKSVDKFDSVFIAQLDEPAEDLETLEFEETSSLELALASLDLNEPHVADEEVAEESGDSDEPVSEDEDIPDEDKHDEEASA